MRRLTGAPWRLLLLTLTVVLTMGSTAVWANALGAGDRFDRLMARVQGFIDPPPDRPTLATTVYTPRPAATASPTPLPIATSPGATQRPDPTPTPEPIRAPVDVNLVHHPDAVFASELTNKDCAVAGTQMVLTILGLGDPSDAFQKEIHDRIGEWESWEDSHNGGWGPAAISLALAAYGAPGYEIRAYDARADALRDAAIALSTTHKPVVLLPWWGAHTWVMTGYRADADPTVFPDAMVTGTYILDPWYPRVSSIWGASDPPGHLPGRGRDGAQLHRLVASGGRVPRS